MSHLRRDNIVHFGKWTIFAGSTGILFNIFQHSNWIQFSKTFGLWTYKSFVYDREYYKSFVCFKYYILQRLTYPNSKANMPRARGKLPVEGDLVKRIFLPKNNQFVDFVCRQHFSLDNKLSIEKRIGYHIKVLA